MPSWFSHQALSFLSEDYGSHSFLYLQFFAIWVSHASTFSSITFHLKSHWLIEIFLVTFESSSPPGYVLHSLVYVLMCACVYVCMRYDLCVEVRGQFIGANSLYPCEAKDWTQTSRLSSNAFSHWAVTQPCVIFIMALTSTFILKINS